MFTIQAVKPSTQEKAVFLYDPHLSRLTDDHGNDLVSEAKQMPTFSAVTTTSRQTPNGKVSPRLLKISLGLSCNYSCEYCSQRFVPRAAETNPGDVDAFIDGLNDWVTSPPDRIEFWGGEPLVYWKTLRPLAEALRAKYPDVQLSIITNGSLLTKEINNWLVAMRFVVGISHDGPGQHVRGPDPLDDPATKDAILSLYRRLAPLKRISFNAMLNRENMSRAEIQKFFVDLTGDQNVEIGEGTFVDAYDEGGLASSLRPDDVRQYRNRAFADIRLGSASNFATIKKKISDFVATIKYRSPSTSLGQKCGMDRDDAIAVDLKGNVLTCQNTSAVGMAPNGESHRIGSVSELDKVALTTATHWSHRDGCQKCPVLQLCQGACMFLEGDLWEATCNNAYSDNVVVLAFAIEFLTGFVPVYIDGPLPEHRKNIWEPPAPPSAPARRVIAINRAETV